MLTFLHPLFLYAGAALVVPVVLHLMKKQVPVNILFPSITFIMREKLPREGRRRLRDVILLLIRLLLFMLVIFALARPQWIEKRKSESLPAEKNGGKNIVIILDLSSSMNGWDGIRKGGELIRGILDKNAGSEFAMVGSSNRASLIVPFTEDKNKILAPLTTVTAEPFEGKHQAALEMAVNLLSKKKSGKEICIVSDFQITDWSFSRPVLPGGIELNFADTCPERTENVAIAGCSAHRINSSTVEVYADIQNFGNGNQTRSLSLEAGNMRTSLEINIPAKKKMTFKLRAENLITQSGVLSLNDDEYNPDNSYSLWLGEAVPVKLMAFLPQKEEPERTEELFFLQKAFSAKSGFSEREYELNSFNVDVFPQVEMKSADGILLLGACGYFDDNCFKILHSYLENGGTVLCSPGRTAGTQYLALKRNGVMNSEFAGFLQIESSANPVYVTWINPESWLQKLFPDPSENDIFFFPIYHCVRFKTSKTAETMMKSGDNPLLFSEDIGKGRIYYSALAFNPEWSSLALTTAFLPFIREIFGRASGESSDIIRLSCGEEVPDNIKANLASVKLINPSKQNISEKNILNAPAVFTVAEMPVEVNVSRKESVPQKQSLNMLRNQLVRMENKNTTPSGSVFETEVKNNPAAFDLWPACALAAALILILEFLAAYIFDRMENKNAKRI